MTYQNYPQQYAGLELLETPVMIVERNGQLLFANPACESLLKVGRKELQKHSLYALFHDARALKNAVQMALAEGCMATAWVYGVVGVHNWQLPLFPDQAQQDFLAKGGPERDRMGVDPDGDGFACAWDPRPFRLQ